ncbi:MAG TPA: hypothetical protein VF136_10025 [Methylomirabilota bacterium]
MTDDSTYSPPASLSRVQRFALFAGVAGLALCGLGYAADHHQFARSYLMAFVFWSGVALGCLALLMISHLSGGAWGVVSRRVFEAASRTLPLLAILFVPVALGLQDLYLWAQPEAVAADPILQHKAPYLNDGFFLARTLLYFVIWSAMAWFLSAWSRRQDEGSDTGLRMQRLSGGGLLVYAITVFFMSVDWIMSLDPHWFSTVYGMLFMVGQGLSALAFTIAVVVLLARTEPFRRVVGAAHLHDLGKLMFAFVMLWAYLTFSQFLIVWSANLPEEIPWYLARMEGGWGWVGLLLIFGHFFLPFFILLNRDVKRDRRLILTVAVFILAVRFVDLFWLIGPPHGAHGVAVHWLDVVAPLGLGGLFVAVFLWQLASRPLLPVGDPYLQEALEHGRSHH